MRLLVCGSRHWPDYHRVEREITALAPSLVMHGGARGADECADMFCGGPAVIPTLVFRADWNAHGKAAGPIRNDRMLRDGKPDRGLAFGPLWKFDHIKTKKWKRTGTGDMVARMLAVRLPVRWVATPDAAAVDLLMMPEP